MNKSQYRLLFAVISILIWLFIGAGLLYWWQSAHAAPTDAILNLHVRWPDNSPAVGVMWVADGVAPGGMGAGLARGFTDSQGNSSMYLGEGVWQITVSCVVSEFLVGSGPPTPGVVGYFTNTLCIESYLPLVNPTRYDVEGQGVSR